MAAGELTLAVVGDVRINRPDPASLFTGCASVLREADMAFCNLEGIYSDRGSPLPGKIEAGSGHRRLPIKSIEGLTAAGFQAVALANNHNMDWGPDALLQTVELLDKMGIAHCGGGRNLGEARKPAILERNSVRVAFLSYTSVFIAGFSAGENTPGVTTVAVDTAYIPPPNFFYQPGVPPIIRTVANPKDMDLVVEDVKNAKSQADIVIVNWHWGVYPGVIGVRDYQKVVAREAIDAGADLIAGHHPHMLHGMEFYKGKLICYSLNHFAFDMVRNPYFGEETLILKCHIRDKKIQKLTFVPCLINDQNQPMVLDPKKGRRVVEFVEDWSAEFNTAYAPEGNEVTITTRKVEAPPPATVHIPAAWYHQAIGYRAQR